MPTRNLTILFFAMLGSLICYHRATHNRYASALAEGMGHVHQFFVEPIDRRVLFEGSMKGMVKELDQYSGFVDSKHINQFMEDLDQEFGGVGIIVDIDPDTERLMVVSPLVNTPAYNEGIRAGDLIMEIEGKDTVGMTSADSVGIIRGKPDTDVNLTILPYGQKETRQVVLKRAIIPIESVMGDRRKEDSSWDFSLQEDPRIGYVRLTSFGENSADDLEAAITDIINRKETQGLIFDLRGNAGGLLTAAVKICNMFLDEGNIVSIKSRGEIIKDQYSATSGTIVPDDLPVVVLIDHYSASASEIVSACLQDHDRAVVVGERSWGKGTVQSVFPLEGGRSALRLTTATYWRPSGRNIHRLAKSKEEDEWGVSPDAGFEVKLERDDYIKFLQWRRDRDVPRRRSGAALIENSDAAPISTSETDSAESSDGKPESGDSPKSTETAESTAEADAKPATDQDGLTKEELESYVDPHVKKALEYLLPIIESTEPLMNKAA